MKLITKLEQQLDSNLACKYLTRIFRLEPDIFNLGHGKKGSLKIVIKECWLNVVGWSSSLSSSILNLYEGIAPTNLIYLKA